jgi:ActD protein
MAKPSLLLAEFDSTSSVLHAAEKVRDAGYTKWDVHTPFPVHGMEKAMGLRDSRVGWIVLGAALTGLSGAYLMMYWMNGVDYRLVVGGKPPEALPSMVPILFELTILLSAFGSLLGMLHLNRLPRHHHPVFESDRFRAASDDKFFISIESEDPKFSLSKTKELLESVHPAGIEVIEEGA